MAQKIKKVVLAYSGGLDTSVILKWLQEQYDCEVVTFTADIGQGEELEPERAKAKKAGVKQIFIDHLRDEVIPHDTATCDDGRAVIVHRVLDAGNADLNDAAFPATIADDEVATTAEHEDVVSGLERST